MIEGEWHSNDWRPADRRRQSRAGVMRYEEWHGVDGDYSAVKAARNRGDDGRVCAEENELAGRGWRTTKVMVGDVLAYGRREEDKTRAVFEGTSEPCFQLVVPFARANGRLKHLLIYSRAVFLFIMLFAIPYQFAFKEVSVLNNAELIEMLIIVDIHNWIKIVLEATIIPVVNRDGQAIYSPKLILRKYLNRHFHLIYNIIMLFPFYAFGADLAMIRLIGVMESRDIKMFIKWILSGLFFFLPYTKRMAQKKLFGIELMYATVILYLSAHFLTCLWIRANKYFYEKPLNDYIDSLYLIMATASTVGYGDKTVDNKSFDDIILRYLFAIGIIIAALNYFAYLQSLINILIFDWNLTKVEDNMSELDQLEDWLAARICTQGVDITRSYELKIKRYFKFRWNRDVVTALKKNNFIQLMDHSMRKSVEQFATYDTRETYPFFNCISESTAVDLCSRFSIVNFGKGEHIIYPGDASPGVYMILKGTVEIRYCDKPLQDIKYPGHFGHECLVTEFTEYMYIAKIPVICLFLSKVDILDELVDNHIQLEMLHRSVRHDMHILGIARSEMFMFLKDFMEGQKTKKRNVFFPWKYKKRDKIKSKTEYTPAKKPLKCSIDSQKTSKKDQHMEKYHLLNISLDLLPEDDDKIHVSQHQSPSTSILDIIKSSPMRFARQLKKIYNSPMPPRRLMAPLGDKSLSEEGMNNEEGGGVLLDDKTPNADAARIKSRSTFDRHLSADQIAEVKDEDDGAERESLYDLLGEFRDTWTRDMQVLDNSFILQDTEAGMDAQDLDQNLESTIDTIQSKIDYTKAKYRQLVTKFTKEAALFRASIEKLIPNSSDVEIVKYLNRITRY